jgi:hypothetical protein
MWINGEYLINTCYVCFRCNFNEGIDQLTSPYENLTLEECINVILYNVLKPNNNDNKDVVKTPTRITHGNVVTK